ncbi:MAG: 3-oxoadipate enol-lactonase / 4-carboxymuconolactone decarboxylase [Pseudonocardiales bacterium]|jgi:3-oxoadipate enol-lactonase/4-carboxymuconolactone decarboxylase|nr:3-oxoadipate enol-lactonase / 4-carboxymuconolactone decarboxylase [Pseudonocardiales bacterium]
MYHEVHGPTGAPALVLLNSVGTTSAMWSAQLGALSEQFRVIMIDTRGHGKSPAAPTARTTIAGLGADVLGVLDSLRVERAHLAGLSLGGMTAMWIAAHHPQRVARLAVLCSSAHLPPEEFWRTRAAAVRADGMASIAAPVVDRWTTPDLAARDADLLAELRAMFSGNDAESYAQCCEAIAEMDLRPDLARIAAPTLVIAAKDDAATPPDHGRVIADGIAGARLEIVPQAAHIATVEQPGRITRLLLEHFGAASPTPGFATRRAVLGDEHVDRAISATTPFTRPFQEFITRAAWGDVWSRPGLGRRDRSIATLAALVTLGAEHEIAMHVRGALANGLTVDEIAEVLLHTALYAGLPRANRAFAIAQQVLAEHADDQET